MVTPELAAPLVEGQFPEWAGLVVQPLAGSGSDNVMIRLGDGLVLRFPRVASAVEALRVEALRVEARWLGWLAGVSPLAVPEVVALGRPGVDYPWPWAVLRWIPGTDALVAPVEDEAAAKALAAFVAAPGRAAFRKIVAVDDATWARGWAYAFSKAVMAAPYCRDTNPALREVMLRTLRRCVSDRPDCMERPRWL